MQNTNNRKTPPKRRKSPGQNTCKLTHRGNRARRLRAQQRPPRIRREALLHCTSQNLQREAALPEWSAEDHILPYLLRRGLLIGEVLEEDDSVEAEGEGYPCADEEVCDDDEGDLEAGAERGGGADCAAACGAGEGSNDRE